MNGWTESFRGVVYPWHCDHLGHMNVQHYVGMFDQAAFHFESVLGLSYHDMDTRGTALVDVQHTIRYMSEQRAGSLVMVETCVIRVGTKSVTMLLRMKNTETGDVAATSERVCVFFDLKERTSLPIPDELRASFEAHLVEET